LKYENVKELQDAYPAVLFIDKLICDIEYVGDDLLPYEERNRTKYEVFLISW